ncbi:unnamed protein product [Larinioides sclopetarius]|uniref:Uncharacterized protein n=2 Tax=Larinioides sclopetarius TaxID=280406 RepID=A0AAV1ZFD5_9ARAC
MNSVILSVFVGILLVACVQSQSNTECNLKCRNNEYCYRREFARFAVECCRRYQRKGAICDDGRLRCNPEQECKPRRQFSIFRFCQDKTQTTSESTTMTMTMPTTPTMMTTDTPTASTDMSSISTDISTLSTDIPTDMSTDMSTDIFTEATDETTTQ